MPPRSVTLTKRAIDIAGALVGIGVTLPLLPWVALAIQLDSPGPFLFRQKRAGKLRRGATRTPEYEEFYILKFRTMRTDAEKVTGAVIAAKDDDRVTKVGRFLRRTRLDELPQFVNVLVGDMSLIGPRPERPELLTNLALTIPYFEERMRDVKPGITGLAQIELGYTGTLPEESILGTFKDTLQNPYDLPEAEGALADSLRIKLLYDLAYAAALEHFSTFITTELKILLKTPLVMLRGSDY